MKRGVILWVMGPTSSGKTTICNALLKEMRQADISVLHYDGDEVRDFYGDSFCFEAENRLQVVKTICHLANKAIEAVDFCLVSALTANPDARQHVLQNVENLRLIYLNCPLQECMERDPKGLYAKAAEGKIDTLVGYNTPYPVMDNAHLYIETSEITVNEAVTKIMEFVHKERS